MRRLAIVLGFAFAVMAGNPYTGNARAGCAIEALGETPIKVTGSGLFEIEAAIRDQTFDFFVDTGAMMTTLDQPIVDRLNLPLIVGMGNQMVGANGGHVALGRTRISELTIGGTKVRNVDMAVIMAPQLGHTADGLLGSDFLTHFDLEFDVAGGTLRFFRQSRCGDSGAVYWSDRYSVVPIAIRRNHIIVPVTVDGHEFRALLDSGASSTSLSWSAARQLGVTPDTPGVVARGKGVSIDGQASPTMGYQFRELKVAGEVVRQPKLKIGNLAFKDADMILGADFLRAHRVYIATDDERLYFTWNGSTAFAR
jgi:clan AA aspartic protease (TIGR02281 family)